MPEHPLHAEIIAKVREYYHQVHQPAQEQAFRPGKDKIQYAGRVFDDEEMAMLADATLEFWLTHGRYARQFEQELGKFLGLRFTLAVNSGSSANLLALMTLTSPLLQERRLERGDEVITVAAGFPTTVAPLVQYGAVPVFVDVELSTANVDASLLAAAWSPRVKAVMLAHTLGNPFDLHAVTAFCQQHNLWLIEDNCDALGSLFAGRPTGSWGDLGTSSFYPPHHLTMGEGGAVYTNNTLLNKIALSMRDWGRDCWCPSGADNTCGCRFSGQHGSLPPGYDHKYVYSHFGYNLKPTDLQAAIGCAQLAKLQRFTASRRRNFQQLYERLADTPFLRLPSYLADSVPSWFGFLLIVDKRAPFTRNDLTAHLENNGIQTRNLFAGNLLRHPCFESLCEGKDYRTATPLVNTDIIMHRAFWIGVYPGMSETQLDYMAQTIHRFTTSF